MIRLEFPPAQQGTRIARIPGRLLTELRLWQPGGEAAYVTDDVDSMSKEYEYWRKEAIQCT